MMKNKIWSKLFLSLTLVAIILFCGFFLVIFTAFLGGGKFYTPLAMFITVALIIFTIMRIFNLVKPKILITMLSSFLIFCILAVGVRIVNKAYHNSFVTVNEQGVNLNEYKPFIEKTKVAKLEEAPSLKINSNLPRLDGATALYPLYASFAQAAYPEREYNLYNSEVMCNNTVGSYENLIKGEADIIFTARPSKEQMEMAKTYGVELKLTPIGREAFVFFVNAKNNISELSTKEIQGIYSGEVKSWKEVGGKNDKIRAFQRPENSGSQTMLQKLMEGKNLMTPPKEDVVAGMGGIIEKTSSYRNYKNAIGYSFLFFATEMVKDKEIKLLKIDGVYPDRNAIRNKEYPLAAEFYAVTAGSKNPNIESFIRWILSKQGQYLVEKTGYTPFGEK